MNEDEYERKYGYSTSGCGSGAGVGEGICCIGVGMIGVAEGMNGTGCLEAGCTG